MPGMVTFTWTHELLGWPMTLSGAWCISGIVSPSMTTTYFNKVGECPISAITRPTYSLIKAVG